MKTRPAIIKDVRCDRLEQAQRIAVILQHVKQKTQGDNRPLTAHLHDVRRKALTLGLDMLGAEYDVPVSDCREPWMTELPCGGREDAVTECDELLHTEVRSILRETVDE